MTLACLALALAFSRDLDSRTFAGGMLALNRDRDRLMAKGPTAG